MEVEGGRAGAGAGVGGGEADGGGGVIYSSEGK